MAGTSRNSGKRGRPAGQPVNPSVEPEEIAAYETWSEEEKQTLRRVAPLAEKYDYAL